jgi:zinc transport system ATP-binding protein
MSEPSKKYSVPDTPAITIKNLQVELGGVEILTGVNIKIKKGAITALIGPNGAGKTTLVLAIMDVIKKTGGSITFGNNDERPVIGYVPQHLDFDRSIPVTVMDFLCMWKQRKPIWISHSKKISARALEALGWVEASHLADRMMGNLSGGELQRVLLAMALLEEPEIIFLDEPASAVDKSGEELFMKLIRKIHEERGITFLLISHDISMVTKLANQVICLNQLVLSAGDASSVLNEQNLSACFGSDKGLLLHDHPWQEFDGEIQCAHCDDDHEHGEE